MTIDKKDLLIEKCTDDGFERLKNLRNPKLIEFVAEYVGHCSPDSVYVCSDTEEDFDCVRRQALENGEEVKLALEGCTAHFDGYHDQARDTKNTKILIPKGTEIKGINTMPREDGLPEVTGILKDIMKGRQMYVMFLCLGPRDSEFSIPCVQLTDSAYVAHNEILLFRPGYDQFMKLKNKDNFFRFVHSAGELDERKTCKNIDKRRVYIDLEGGTVYSTNTQYGGNSIGLKKLAMRLAIKKASTEGWLTEHMFVMGVHGPKDRVTYFTGAYPSMCGKTATAMMPGETIVGDDIAYLIAINGKVRAVNVEKGLFGIIKDVNSKDDPLIYEALTSPAETIFSNVLIDESNNPYWIGRDGKVPNRGVNHSGEWFPGKKDEKGSEITPSHKNARFTIAIESLKNADPAVHDPKGVEIGGIIYGGRDSDTTVPVEQSFDWSHGILTKGATLESETTAATLGQEGVRKFNLMSNIEFVSIPLGRYIQDNLDLGSKAEKPPLVFSVNYFLKGKDGKFLNSKEDKRVWLKWMELRVHGEVGALKTPTGHSPKYDDLKRLFKEVLKRDYSKQDYEEQFKFRTLEHLAKIDRIEVIYKQKIDDTPKALFKALDEQRKRIEAAREKYGDYILPEKFA
ncbi:MAG: phosphoenolpyruvate carboxykinase (GTP) [Candidatus Altiarchaeota archaeon]